MKLEIPLAIPASNEWKIETHTSAGQRSTIYMYIYMHMVNPCPYEMKKTSNAPKSSVSRAQRRSKYESDSLSLSVCRSNS